MQVFDLVNLLLCLQRPESESSIQMTSDEVWFIRKDSNRVASWWAGKSLIKKAFVYVPGLNGSVVWASNETFLSIAKLTGVYVVCMSSNCQMLSLSRNPPDFDILAKATSAYQFIIIWKCKRIDHKLEVKTLNLLPLLRIKDLYKPVIPSCCY